MFQMGEQYPILLYTPPGVTHGFRVLSPIPATIITLITESFKIEQPDNYPIAWDDPQIGFDWEKPFITNK